MPSLAHGSRGTELRGLAQLDIAPFTSGSLPGMVPWHDGMFQRVERQIKRYKGKRTWGTKVNAWGTMVRVRYKGTKVNGVVDRAELTYSPNIVISNAEALDQLSSGSKQQKGR